MLVICCNAMGNETSENFSNVPRLYRCLRKTDKTRAARVNRPLTNAA
jgi:hypothetical protein